VSQMVHKTTFSSTDEWALPFWKRISSVSTLHYKPIQNAYHGD